MNDLEIWYIHQFKVSSGKTHKVITKAYRDKQKATENYMLLGGVIYQTKELTRQGKL